MLKVDLHTHSIASPDGSLTIDQYVEMIDNNKLDYFAVTDHDTISFAKEIKKTLGDIVIVGQEITCQEGEIIGLYLTNPVKPHQPIAKAAKDIKKQGGLVYIPHPFETVRKGLTKGALDSIKDLVDIVEVYNGRAFVQNKGPRAAVWARVNQKATSASSDAHGTRGLATAYNVISEIPTVNNLVEQLNKGHKNMKRPPLPSLLYPKLNRLKQRMKRGIIAR